MGKFETVDDNLSPASHINAGMRSLDQAAMEAENRQEDRRAAQSVAERQCGHAPMSPAEMARMHAECVQNSQDYEYIDRLRRQLGPGGKTFKQGDGVCPE